MNVFLYLIKVDYLVSSLQLLKNYLYHEWFSVPSKDVMEQGHVFGTPNMTLLIHFGCFIVFLSVCLSVRLSVCLSVCLRLSLFPECFYISMTFFRCGFCFSNVTHAINPNPHGLLNVSKSRRGRVQQPPTTEAQWDKKGRVHIQTSYVTPRFWNLDFKRKKIFN